MLVESISLIKYTPISFQYKEKQDLINGKINQMFQRQKGRSLLKK